MKTCHRFVVVVFSLCLLALTAHAANITVISIADSGPGSLRQAILDANNGDTITFDPILATKKIALTSGELVINKNITITGLGTANLAVTGTSTSRVFSVTDGANATLAALTISDGNATNGGGIANFGALTLDGIQLTNNTATRGGAILTSNGVLVVSNSTLSANAADDGGAIFVASGSATLTHSTVSLNTATVGTGGGLASHGTLTVHSSTLISNSATFAGGLYSTNGTATVTASIFSDNSASAGGAIYNDSNSTMSLLASNVVTLNTAFGGGGLYNEGTLSITASAISSNLVSFDGGGLYNAHHLLLDGVTFADNRTGFNHDARGGGLFSTNGVVTVTNATFTGNHASNGGGLYNHEGTLSITDSVLSNNSASFEGSGTGGGLHNRGDLVVARSRFSANEAVAGGGLANYQRASIEDSTFSDNFGGGAGGGLFNVGDCAVYRSTFADNQAAIDGGAIYNETDGTLLVVISTFANNSTFMGFLGGNALHNHGKLTLAETTLAGNQSLFGFGQAASLFNGGTMTVDNTIFADSVPDANILNFGVITSKGHNLSDDDSGVAFLTAGGDLNETPAGLDPAGLEDNGGPTATIALAEDSAALLAGGPVYAPFSPVTGGGEPIYPPFTDQRGLPRFVCGTMDIGAFQTQSTTPPTIELIGGSVLTNECLGVFVDPGAAAANTCGGALSIAAGGAHSLALQQDGVVVGWGDNSSGQATVPGSLTGPIVIAAGEFHSLGLREDGAVIAWGNNANGQASVPGNATNAIAISAGGFHSLAVDESGSVLGWGDSTFGQTNIPAGVSNAVAVAAGRYHSLALLGDGTVVGWGGGTFTAIPEDGVNYGQANVPAGLSNIVAIAAGAYHSLGLRNDGLVIAWGAGTSNLFPFVDFGQSVVPANLSNVVAIAAGGFHSLALVNDGTVMAWGNNTYGQATVPAALHQAEAIAGGTYHSLAIATGGAVAGWGLNSNGQTVATADLLAFNLSSQITVTTNGSLGLSGTATLTYAVGDARGLSNSISRAVLTIDSTAPVPDVASLPIITNTCSVTLAKPTATDACAGAVIATTSDATNYTARGTHTVNWVYTDLAGNSATQTQTVVIDRPTPPAIACPGDIVTGNTAGQCGAIVFFNTPVTTPNCSSAVLTQLAGLPSGSLFPLGVTTNLFQVTDLDANTAQCSFTVTVSETQPPTLTCPSNVITSTIPGQCQSGPITYPVTVADNCPGATVTFNPTNGSTFFVGTNAVTAFATDAAGNTNLCTFNVIIKDSVGPQVTCPVDIVTNAMTSAGTVVTLPTILATDSCSATSVLLTPPSGSVFPVGATVVTATAFDISGNQTLCQFSVTVRTPRSLLEGASVQAQSLQIALTGSSNLKQFSKALDSLLATLAAGQWQGGLHLSSSSGKKTLSSARKAVRTFVKLSRRADTGIDAAQWLALATQISDSAHSVAAIAIADATQAGGNAKKIASANQSLARGVAAVAPDKAIQEYTKAWQGGIKARP